MWPLAVPWTALRFGVELEFVGGRTSALDLLPGWQLLSGEAQTDDDGSQSGGELVPPPLAWAERSQLREMLTRLRHAGARAGWSCGLHVHVGLQPWGEAAVLPLVQAALACQEGLSALLRTAPHRVRFCPPVTVAMERTYRAQRRPEALERRGRPQSHRCGINAKAWYDHGTVELRLPNASLDYGEVRRTAECCLRFVAAVGAGRGAALPAAASALAAALGAPAGGYPPPVPAPLWHWERLWLEEALLPVVGPVALARVPGEVLSIRPAGDGLWVVVERPDGSPEPVLVRWTGGRFAAVQGTGEPGRSVAAPRARPDQNLSGSQ